MNNTYQSQTRPVSHPDSKLNDTVGVAERTGQWLRWAIILISVLLPAGGMLASSRRSGIPQTSGLESGTPMAGAEAKHTFLIRRSSPPSGPAPAPAAPQHRDRSQAESRLAPFASTGSSALLTFQGSGAPTSDGDYVSSLSGLD